MWKLKIGGQAGIVLANGSMSSNTSGEGDIREAMIKGDVVEVMISLPDKLFLNTSIPCCLWFLTNDKTKMPIMAKTVYIVIRPIISVILSITFTYKRKITGIVIKLT